MKKILSVFVLIVCLSFAQAAHADACGASLTTPFTSFQAKKLCAAFSYAVPGTVAGAGTTQADATSVGTSTVIKVTGADGTVGVNLPALSTLQPGSSVAIINSSTASALKVYSAAAGELISGQSGTTAISLAAKLILTCTKYDASNWYCGKSVTPY